MEALHRLFQFLERGMTRTSQTNLDAEIREAVEAAARRSGMSLDEWVTAAIVEQSRRTGPVRKQSRPAAQDDLDIAIDKLAMATRAGASLAAPKRTDEASASRMAVALASIARWIEQAETRLNEAAHGPVEQQERLAVSLTDALHAIKDRLDRMETQGPGIHGPGSSPDVIRTTAALRSDVAALASRLDELSTRSDPWHAALQGIQREVERLRASFGSLVTRDEVATLEDLVRSLAADLAEPDSRSDIAALAESIAQVQSEVRHLTQEVSRDLHRRITVEVEGLARKLDQVAAAGAGRAGVEALGHQIADMRQALARMADPQRIERLAEEVSALGRHVAELRAEQVAPGDFASLKSAFEDIRMALQRSQDEKAASEVPGELKSLNRRLDLLMSRPESAGLDPIMSQLSALTQQIGSLASTLSAERRGPVEALTFGMDGLKDQVDALAEKLTAGPDVVMGRIDRLEDTVRQIGEQADTARLEIMLRELLEKLAQDRNGSASLDGLERRLESLTSQLTRSASDQVQQALTETLAHVKTLRGEAAIIAERAAKAAIREAQAAAPTDPEAVKQGFTELRALQADAEKRTQATLKAVHNALETLLLRQPAGAVEPRSATAPASSSTEALPASRLEAAVRKLHAAALSQVETPLPTLASAIEPEPEETLLEPGTPRGAPGTSFIASQDGEPGHARASFIAAARRAAQAASADADMKSNDVEEEASAETAPTSKQTLIERIRQTFDSHRRPLLLGMALLILVAGSLQTISWLGTPLPNQARIEGSSTAGTPVPAIGKQDTAAASALEPPAEALPNEAGINLLDPAHLDPVHVSSVSPAPVLSAIHVPGIKLSDLPSSAPAPLAEAAGKGEGAAVYELASRLAEGRTLPHEPTLAAKLFEKAAQAGLIPAQFRIGAMYERGIGVSRNLELARSWYERAAAGGNMRAMHNLAVLLAEGAGAQSSYAEASRWFQEASEFGVRDSQYNLGVLLARGLGIPQDLAKSYQWFSLAAAQGDDDAGRKRDEIGARLSPEALAAARAVVAQWKAKVASPAANEVAQPASGFTAVRNGPKRG